MAGFTVYQDSYIGATIISNRFIDEYMTEANDAQLKVYLYLVRMLNAHLETNVTDIADRFNHTEKDVLRAFSYWEKKGLLTLDYNEGGELVGVHLVNLCKSDAKGPSVESTHKKTKPQPAVTTLVQSVAPVISVTPAVEVIGPEVSSIAAGQKTSTISAGSKASSKKYVPQKQVVFLAETYFNRPISQTDVQTLGFIQDELNFSFELIDYLLQFCVEKGKRDFRYVEKVAIGWKEKGVTTVEEALMEGLKHEKIVYVIMNRLGKQSAPTDVELEYIKRWRGEYAFSDEMIFEACDRTVMATDKHRFQYCEGILASWNKKGIRSLEEVKMLDDSFRGSGEGQTASTSGKKGGLVTEKKGSAGSFGQFEQTETDFDELAKKIFIN